MEKVMKMKRLARPLIIIMVLLLLLLGCRKTQVNEYKRYTGSFLGTFDTVIQVVAYTKSEEEFSTYFELIKTRFQELHKLYDIYHNYGNINNIKTINDNAGIKAVPVAQEIIDLILFAKDWYRQTGGRTNIAMGPVLKIWHDYRTQGIENPAWAKLPPPDELRQAARHTDIDQVIVDTDKGTVYLADEGMSLDVGAVAKGFATEIVVQELMAAGLKAGIISAGGNVRTIGKPLDSQRERWSIGVQDPIGSLYTSNAILDTLFVTDAAVVSSGNYQRYYTVDGEMYHHLIDPETLMPAKHFKGVTVVAPDSGLADFLSTTAFLLPFLESKGLVESLPGVEALWVLPDGSIEVTEGMEKMLASRGATAAR
ncbi:MAG: FAD:protein FMN transferase [bacterium]